MTFCMTKRAETARIRAKAGLLRAASSHARDLGVAGQAIFGGLAEVA